MANNERIDIKIVGVDELSPTLQKIDKQYLESTNSVKKYEEQSVKSLKKIQREANSIRRTKTFKSNIGNIRSIDDNEGSNQPSNRGPSKRSISSAFRALRGNAQGFLSLGTQVGGIGLAFGAVGAAVVGVGSHIAELTETMRKNRAVVQASFSGTPEQLESITVKATALSNSLGSDYNITVQAANQLTRQFGMSGDQAFALLKKGALAGANASGDMLEQLQSLGGEMSALGLNAEQQLALLGQAAKFGGADVLVASLQGFKDELADFGQGTTALLTDAFGKDFTSNFRKNVKSGKVGMQDALQTISEAFNKTSLSGRELENAIQDTFGAAGAQLGIGGIKNLQTLNLNLDQAVQKNGQLNQSIKAQMELDEQLAGSQARLAKTFEGFGAGLSKLWTNIKIGFYDMLSGFGDMVNEPLDRITKEVKKQQDKMIFADPKKWPEKIAQLADENAAYFNKMADSKGQDIVLSQVESGLSGVDSGVRKMFIEELKKRRVIQEQTSTTELTKGKGTDFFKTKEGSDGTKSLDQGVNNIITGGKEMRNVTVNIDKMVGAEQIINSTKASPAELERMMLELLTRVIQNAELTLAK